MAVRLTATTLSQASGGIWSTGSVSPAMPALLIRTSSPPSAATAFGTMRSISARTAMSQWLAITPGISWTMALRALSSMSQTKTVRAVGGEGARKFAADAGGTGSDENTLWHWAPPVFSFCCLLQARLSFTTNGAANAHPVLSCRKTFHAANFVSRPRPYSDSVTCAGNAGRAYPQKAPRYEALARLWLPARLPAARSGRARALGAL